MAAFSIAPVATARASASEGLACFREAPEPPETHRAPMCLGLSRFDDPACFAQDPAGAPVRGTSSARAERQSAAVPSIRPQPGGDIAQPRLDSQPGQARAGYARALERPPRLFVS